MDINLNISVIKAIALFALIDYLGAVSSAGEGPPGDYPDPVSSPDSPVMLAGNWVADPHEIDFNRLPIVPSRHAMVSDELGSDGHRVNQHNYLVHYDGRFWIMWSDGPGVSRGPGVMPAHDRPGQRVSFSTSEDGLNWSEIRPLTDSREGFVWVARGFWIRDGELLALASLSELRVFQPSLELRALRWEGETEEWKDIGVVYPNALNNFPPKRLPTGEWMMSRRAYNYKTEGVHFLVGGNKGFDHWESYPVFGSTEGFSSEEPYWWELPDGNLMALFRDNAGSGFLFRSFSRDNGRTWTRPIQTDFPDARAKFHGLRLSDGRYVLVSNPHPRGRNPLAISLSDDGMVFTSMGYLIGERPNLEGIQRSRAVDYPHVIEHEGYLYIAFNNVKQTIEVLKVAIDDLENLEMTDARIPPPYEPVAGDIIIDHSDVARVTVRGDWGTSDRSADRHGDSYRFLPSGEAGAVRYDIALPRAGEYEVYAIWNNRGGRASNVPYTIKHGRGTETVKMDQRVRSGEWVSLGRYHFGSEGGSVTIEIDQASNYVIADAVRFGPRDQK